MSREEAAKEVTASQLRTNIYRLLDEVLETGVPLEIQRKGRTLRIVADEQPSKLARLVPHPGYIVGDPDELAGKFHQPRRQHGKARRRRVPFP